MRTATNLLYLVVKCRVWIYARRRKVGDHVKIEQTQPSGELDGERRIRHGAVVHRSDELELIDHLCEKSAWITKEQGNSTLPVLPPEA